MNILELSKTTVFLEPGRRMTIFDTVGRIQKFVPTIIFYPDDIISGIQNFTSNIFCSEVLPIVSNKFPVWIFLGKLPGSSLLVLQRCSILKVAVTRQTIPSDHIP